MGLFPTLRLYLVHKMLPHRLWIIQRARYAQSLVASQSSLVYARCIATKLVSHFIVERAPRVRVPHRESFCDLAVSVYEGDHVVRQYMSDRPLSVGFRLDCPLYRPATSLFLIVTNIPALYIRDMDNTPRSF